jgi:hypothetical protein
MAKQVLPKGVTMGRTLQVGDWHWVKPGCTVQSGGDWAPHFNLGAGSVKNSY